MYLITVPYTAPMKTNARMLVALPLSTLLLTACSVNAPVTNDIHDNYVEIPNATINTPDWKVPSSSQFPTPVNPMPSTDPNAKQDVPDSWGDDDVDPDLNIEPSPSFSPPNT